MIVWMRYDTRLWFCFDVRDKATVVLMRSETMLRLCG